MAFSQFAPPSCNDLQKQYWLHSCRTWKAIVIECSPPTPGSCEANCNRHSIVRSTRVHLNGTSLHLQYSNSLAVPPDGPIRAILTPGASLGSPLDEADNRKRLALPTHHATHPPTPLYFCRPCHGLFSVLTTGCIVPATHSRVGQRETPDVQYHEHVIATTGTSTNGRQSDIYHITAPNLPIISRFTWALSIRDVYVPPAHFCLGF